jgi:hypothetical protein
MSMRSASVSANRQSSSAGRWITHRSRYGDDRILGRKVSGGVAFALGAAAAGKLSVRR